MNDRNAPDPLPKQLEEEYKMLISRWEDFDRRALGIKGWVAAGSIVATINLKPDTSLISVFFAGAILLAAWFLEAIWKSWQHANQQRIMELEKFFRGENDGTDLKPFQIQTTWTKVNGPDFSFRRAFAEMPRPFVCLPYIVVFILLLLYSLNRCIITLPSTGTQP